jgi:hypothetical protein
MARSFGRTLLRVAGWSMLIIVTVAISVWGGLALWFDGPASRGVAGVLAGAFVAVSVALPLVLRWRGLAIAASLWVILLVWWLYIPPRADRDWLPDVAELPAAGIQGERVTISNVRNFDYRSESDFTPRWEQRTYDLGQVRGLDIFLSYWGSPLIAHTIMSWEFDDGQHLAISIETRKERGESYSALRGFFRQYELYYVVADERDVIGVRANHRDERVYLYRLAVPPAQARALLLAYLERVNRLARQPAWYNAFTQNCTTTIRMHVQEVGVRNPWNWRILVNGRGDELFYERGYLNRELPFADLKARSDVTARAQAARDAPEFSARIREGLPGRRRWPGASASLLDDRNALGEIVVQDGVHLVLDLVEARDLPAG